MTFMDGILAGVLLASLVANLVQYLNRRRAADAAQGAVDAALQHEERLLDRARAAELRSERQIDALLERISTAPRLEVRPAAGTVTAERKYIADTPDADEAWNEYRGDGAEDEVEAA